MVSSLKLLSVFDHNLRLLHVDTASIDVKEIIQCLFTA